MPTYVLLTKLSVETIRDLSKREEIGKKWHETVKKKCPEVRFVSHYALLGPYDFLDIFEAPDENTAAKVALITLSSGATVAETWTAIPYKKLIQIVKELPD